MKAITRVAALALLLTHLEGAHATEFEKLGSAVAKALGTKKAFRAPASVGASGDFFYSKGPSGKAAKYAVIQKATYPPDCTHTWVIGLNGAARVQQIRVVEMKCSHAFPTNKAGFLDQYKGKGPADAKNLKASVQTIAKATGTSELTTEAVKKAIRIVTQVKGKI